MRDKIFILDTLYKMKRAYKAGRIKLDYLPLRLWVELTNNCNLRCSFCPNSKPRKLDRGYMSMDTFKEIVKQSRSFVYDMNLSHRGESLLHDELPAMIAHAKDNGIATRINTNATLLDDEKSRRIIESGLDFISFSFDGLDPDTYESLRPNATYGATIDNIVNFLRLKKESKSILPYVMLEVLDIPSVDASPEAVRKFKANFKDLPLNKFTIKPLHNWGGQIKDGEYVGEKDGGAPQKLKYSPCTNIWYSMVVLWDGSVSVCCQDWYNENSLGNVHDSSLEAMWNGEVIVAIRKLLALKKFHEIEICSECDMLWRPSVGGVPNVNLVSFISENLIGYGWLRRAFSPIEKFFERCKGMSSRKIIR